ncbi:hypothetical protein OA86_02275 [Kaistella jeonii]|uniref:Uncharacterized protein n=1 Tax=Kaistella jeonii TaxID=266749 RepID=A0A0C1D1J6_9FLAO|nr:hypothetical protein OA86_02275 [Kaistella jeonii]
MLIVNVLTAPNASTKSGAKISVFYERLYINFRLFEADSGSPLYLFCHCERKHATYRKRPQSQ